MLDDRALRLVSACFQSFFQPLTCGSCEPGEADFAGQREGLLDDEVAVNLPGGQLVVSWRGNDEPVWLTGDAESISEGTIDL